jgi:hypothetical protein
MAWQMAVVNSVACELRVEVPMVSKVGKQGTAVGNDIFTPPLASFHTGSCPICTALQRPVSPSNVTVAQRSALAPIMTTFR